MCAEVNLCLTAISNYTREIILDVYAYKEYFVIFPVDSQITVVRLKPSSNRTNPPIGYTGGCWIPSVSTVDVPSRFVHDG